MTLTLADSAVADPLDEEEERATAERLLSGADLCPVHGFILLGCPLCAIAIAELAKSLPEAK